MLLLAQAFEDAGRPIDSKGDLLQSESQKFKYKYQFENNHVYGTRQRNAFCSTPEPWLSPKPLKVRSLIVNLLQTQFFCDSLKSKCRLMDDG